MGYPGSFSSEMTLYFRHPSTIEEVLDLNFWYFPRLLEEGPLRNRGAAVWTLLTWGRIARGDYGNIAVIGDLLDIFTMKPREDLGQSARERNQGKNAIETMIGGMPREYQNLLTNAAEDGVRRDWTPPGARNPPKRPFQHCGIHTDLGERNAAAHTAPDMKWIPVEDLYYKYMYKVMAHSKRDPEILKPRLNWIRSEMSRKMGRSVRAAELWKSVYDKEVALLRVPKMNDLLYRLLLGAVECGSGLYWLPEAA